MSDEVAALKEANRLLVEKVTALNALIVKAFHDCHCGQTQASVESIKT